MQEITLERDWQDDATLLDSIRQNCYQFDNFGCFIYRLADGREILYEDHMNESYYYLLEDGDSRTAAEYAAEWASNCESGFGNDYRTERISWRLSSGEDYEVAPDFEGECLIIKVGSFYGYSPVSIVLSCEVDEDVYKDHTFNSREEAQAWIDEQEEGPYYLAHNEADRPAYYIVEA